MRSMTGFGRGEASAPAGRVRVELKTVNHRGFDLRARLPRGLGRAENDVATKVRAAMPRGRVELYADVDGGPPLPEQGRLRLDAASLRSAWAELDAFVDEFGGIERQLTTGQLLANPLWWLPAEGGRNSASGDDAAAGEAAGPYPGAGDGGPAGPPLLEALLEATDRAIADLVAARTREGDALLPVFRARLDAATELVETVAAKSAGAPERFAKTLKERLDGLPVGPVDHGRLAQEVAILADRADVTEELDRLRLHLAHFAELLGSEEPIGRKLDFLCQELNREANTVASKAADAEVAQRVVDLKTEIERLREQVQNIE